MTTPDVIALDLDASSYIQGIGQAEDVTSRFAGSLRSMPATLAPMGRAMDSITPSRATLAGMGALAAAAANTQAQLAGMQAQAKLTGANFGRMSEGMRSLARDLPVSNRGAREMYQTLTRLGVAGTGTEKPLNRVSKAVQGFDKSNVAAIPGMTKLSAKVDDLFGTRGKLTSPNTEKRINELSRTFSKLGTATGESSTQLASSMTRLNQAMGTGMSSKRVTAMSDSLTTLSMRTGASATGILEFSRAIAPMSRAAGIGQTATMGISAAFSKMGEDGFGAANAVGKILSDMGRATREGTPNLAAYSQMVGKTTEQFQELVKNNPAEALIQVTEALGKDPGGAPRMLESVGLDGVRTQRYLQQLSQTGGLREAVSTAVGGYGNGATEQASQEAYRGFSDSAQRAADASEQLAVALGTGLLGPLTLVTDMFGGLASAGEKVVGSGVAQGVMSSGAWAAAAGLLAAKMLSKGLVAAGLGQIASSGPVRGALAGIAMGRAGGNADLARTTLPGRLAGRFIDRVQAGQDVGRGRMQGVNMGAYNRGMALGGFMGMGGTGPGIGRTMLAGGSALWGGYMRMQAETFRNARLPFEQRTTLMRPFGKEFDAYANRRTELMEQRRTGLITKGEFKEEHGRALEKLKKEATGASGGLAGLRRQALLATAAYAGQGMATAASSAVTGAAFLGRGLSAVGRGMGGPVGVGLMGGMAAYQWKQGQNRQVTDDMDRRSQATSFIDDYRVAMGKATEATSTFAGKLESAAEGMARGVTDMADALRIDSQDITAAAGAKRVRKFSGRTGKDAGAALAVEQATVGMSPDEVARISYDLINQYGAEGAQEALNQLAPGGGKDALSQSTDVSGAVNALVNAPDRGGKAGWIGRRVDLNRLMPRSFKGTGWYSNTLSDSTRADTDTLAVGVKTRAAARDAQYGTPFATQEARKEMDQAIATAMKRGDNAQVQELAHAFQQQFGALKNGKTWDVAWKDIDKAGGFTNMVAGRSEAWKSRFGDKAGPEVAPTEQMGWVAERLGGNRLQSWFDKSADSASSGAVQRLLDQPESPRQQLATTQQLLQTSRDAGMSLADLAIEASRAAVADGNAADAAHQLMVAMHGIAQQQMNYAAQFQTPGAALASRVGVQASDAGLDPNDTVTKGIQEAGVAGLAESRGQVVQWLQQWLTNRREANVQATRMQADFNTQMEHAEFDYERQMSRSRAQFRLQEGRAERDFDRQMLHATEDHMRQRANAIEDGARAAYSAYQRIQVQQTWDVPNLLGNIQSQTASLRMQLENLAKVRAGGMESNAIKLLGLNDPNNAQQLAQIVADMASDPRTVRAINDAAKGRQSLAEQLVGDPDNTPLARQDKEFERSMKRAREQMRIAMADMRENQSIAMSQATEDRNTAVERMTDANTRMVTRMADDLVRADTVIVGELEQLSAAYSDVLAGQFDNLGQVTQDGATHYLALARRFGTDLKGIIENQGIVGTFTVGTTRGLLPSDMPGAGVPTQTLPDPKPTQGYTDPRAGRPNAGTGTTGSGSRDPRAPVVTTYRPPATASRVTDELASALAVVGSGIAAGGTSVTNLDYSQTITGVTVVSQDPDEMGQRLMAKQRRANLTSAPQSR